MSADPLTVHALGADLNVYAYVSGKALKATDPLGLEEDYERGVSFEATATSSSGVAMDVKAGPKGGAFATSPPVRAQPKPATDGGKQFDLAPGGAAPPELASAGYAPFEYNADVASVEAEQAGQNDAIEVAGFVGATATPYADIEDASVLLGSESSLGDRAIAGGSLALGYGVLPNVGPALRRIGAYKDAKILIGSGQAHHLNQDAAFGSVIPRAEGVSLKLEGNAFTDVGSPHYQAHGSMEAFWDKFRPGGARYRELPTNLEYSAALRDSLRAAGLGEDVVKDALRASIGQRLDYGMLGGLEVPKVPRKIYQSK